MSTPPPIVVFSGLVRCGPRREGTRRGFRVPPAGVVQLSTCPIVAWCALPRYANGDPAVCGAAAAAGPGEEPPL